MNKQTYLNVLYRKILDKGNELVRYNRIMENFYFRYDISKEYVLEDYVELEKTVKQMKDILRKYQNLIWEIKNELETEISEVKDDTKNSINSSRCSRHKRF